MRTPVLPLPMRRRVRRSRVIDLGIRVVAGIRNRLRMLRRRTAPDPDVL